MNEKMLAIGAQTVYAGSSMADALTPPELAKVIPFKPAEKIAPPKQNGERAQRASQERKGQEKEKGKREKGKLLKFPVEAAIKNPFSGQRVEIGNVDDLVAYFESFAKVARGSEKNPFDGFTNKELKDQYLSNLRLEAIFSRRGEPEQRTTVETYAQEYNNLLFSELAKRKIDIYALSTESRETLEEEGLRLAAAGADRIAEEFADPVIQNIVREINDEITRGGEGEPLDRDFVREVIERTRNRRDTAGIDAPAVEEARRLLGRLNEFREESGAERRERRTRFGMGDVGYAGERPLNLDEDIPAIVAGIDDLTDRAIRKREALTGLELQHDTLDRYFNRVFDKANALPRKDFREAMGSAGEREHTDFMQELERARADAIDPRKDEYRRDPRRAEAKAKVLDQLVKKYGEEDALREILHNAYYIAETEKEFKDLVGYMTSFASHFGDQAFLGSPEVEAALRVRENVLYQIKEENGGLLPPDKVIYNPRPGGSEWETRTTELMEELNRKGMFGGVPGYGLEDWKVKRALSLSRGLGMVILRFPEIVSEIPLAAPGETNQSQPSVPWEKLVWGLNPLDHLVKRYGIAKEQRGILYAAKKRTAKGGWNQDEMKDALALDSVNVLGNINGDPRLVDMRNLFRTGGPMTFTGWRPYNAALDENRDKLRPMLKRNPGLATNMLFNKYETIGMAEERLRIFKRTDRTDNEKQKEWEAYEKVNKGRAEELWGQKEGAYWLASSKRIPHVVFRIIMDEATGVLSKSERQALLDRIASAIGERTLTPQLISEISGDLTLAKEHLMKRRSEAMERARLSGVDPTTEFTEAQDQLLHRVTIGDVGIDDFATIDNDERRARAIAFHRAFIEVMEDGGLGLQDKIVKNVKDRNFPFAVTGEDIPWGEFFFAQTGPRGYFTRKMNDANEVNDASQELVNLLKHVRDYRSPEEIVEQFKKIFYHAEVYDWGGAREVIKDVATGLIRFYQKDSILKIPILGEIVSMARAGAHVGGSYAQTVYGGRAMAWDNDDIYNFTDQLRVLLTQEQVTEIRKETGGQWFQALVPRTKAALYLLFLFFFYEFTKRVVEEK